MSKESESSRAEFERIPEPHLFVLSGPSGVGKDAVLDRLKASGSSDLKYITTVTTRPKRPAEQDGIHYRFVSKEEFDSLLSAGRLLESACVYDNWYGVPRDDVERHLQEGHDVMIKVDIQGVDNIKKVMPEAVSIFLMAPTLDQLLVRLNKRSTETPETLALRLKTAENEMKQLPRFDYAVVNRWEELDRAVEEIKAIITAERCRIRRR